MNEKVTSGKLKITLKWIWNQRQTKMEAVLGEQENWIQDLPKWWGTLLNALLLERKI